MDEENYLEFKKIGTRFLKDIGLYPAFIEYIKNPKSVKPIVGVNQHNWYKKEKIDRMFGQLMFTAFIENKMNCKMDCNIATLFRTYVKKKYGDKFQFHRKSFVKEDEYTSIDADNDIISMGITLKNRD